MRIPLEKAPSGHLVMVIDAYDKVKRSTGGVGSRTVNWSAFPEQPGESRRSQLTSAMPSVTSRSSAYLEFRYSAGNGHVTIGDKETSIQDLTPEELVHLESKDPMLRQLVDQLAQHGPSSTSPARRQVSAWDPDTRQWTTSRRGKGPQPRSPRGEGQAEQLAATARDRFGVPIESPRTGGAASSSSFPTQ